MSTFLNLVIYPFTNHDLFVMCAGILCVTWLFTTIHRLIRL